MTPPSSVPGRQVRLSPGKATEWDLVLYVGSNSTIASKTIETVQTFCDSRLKGRYSLSVLPLSENLERAQADCVPAVPALVRMAPGPVRRIVGNLSGSPYIAVGLGLQTSEEAAPELVD